MNPKQIVKIKFLDHNFLMLQNGNRQAVLAMIDVFIAFFIYVSFSMPILLVLCHFHFKVSIDFNKRFPLFKLQ